VRTLSRYFLASYLKLFVAILFAALIAISIVEMLLNFDQILDDHEGLRGVAQYLFLRLPAYYFRDLIPVTSFAAAFFCIGLAAQSREILAAKAGGVSPHVMVVPILVAATLLSATAFVINETWVLAAGRAASRFENDGAEVSFRRGSFWYHRGDVIYNVQESDPVAKTLHGVRVFETTPSGRLQQSTRAEFVRIDEFHRWHLHDATIRRFDPARPTAAPVVEHVEEAVLDVAAERDLALLDARAQSLSLRELRQYIRARADDGRDTNRFREMLHSRLTDPLTVFAFALVAVPLGLAVERRHSLPGSAVLGIVTLGVFYTARTVVSLLVDGKAPAAALGPWFLLAALLGFGVFRFIRAPR
jgi:LPS export ABC transporter permease LptG